MRSVDVVSLRARLTSVGRIRPADCRNSCHHDLGIEHHDWPQGSFPRRDVASRVVQAYGSRWDVAHLSEFDAAQMIKPKLFFVRSVAR